MLARTRPGTADALRLAAELVDDGYTVALERVPDSELPELCARLTEAGLAGHCEVTVPVDRLRADEVVALADVGPVLALSGPSSAVAPLLPRLPAARIVVPAAEPGAEERCRHLARGHVRLLAGRGAEADLAFVRCLNVLMAADGRPAVATADLRLIAIAGERAAWNGRSPDSWEHVMPYGVRTGEQRRLTAAGLGVRVTVPSGRGAVPATARSLVGRA